MTAMVTAVVTAGSILPSTTPASAAGGAPTAYVAVSSSNGLVPLDVATDGTGTSIAVPAGAWGVAITPDASKAYVTSGSATGTDGTLDDQVTPVDLATGTAGTPIPAGTPPAEVAVTPDGTKAFVTDLTSQEVTPDQAPAARLSVAPSSGSPARPRSQPVALRGRTVSLDASRSRVRFGRIVRYTWRFGDGHRVATKRPFVTHTCASPGTYQVSVTARSSGGTSTRQVFTGQTMSRNGGPSARAELRVRIRS